MMVNVPSKCCRTRHAQARTRAAARLPGDLQRLARDHDGVVGAITRACS